jgi:hypothetical protein
MPADGDDAACTGAGVRKPSMKETAMGKHGRCRTLGYVGLKRLYNFETMARLLR